MVLNYFCKLSAGLECVVAFQFRTFTCFPCVGSSMGVGRGGRRPRQPLDFKNKYFPIELLVKKGCSLSFELVK